MSAPPPLVPTPSRFAEIVGLLETAGCSPKLGREGQWSAKCPVHDDRIPSLRLKEGDDGRVLLYCHAGCTLEAIVGALGVPMTALFANAPQESQRPAQRVRKPTAIDPDDTKYGIVPACLIAHACPLCLQVYARLAWRCGRENRPQRGLAAIARELGIQKRTLRDHATHLAETGWIAYSTTSTSTGARRAGELSLRHCPPFGIRYSEVRRPDRNHGRTGDVARSTHYVSPKGETAPTGDVARSTHYVSQGVRRVQRTPLNAFNAPSADGCSAFNAPQSRYMGNEQVDTWEREGIGEHVRDLTLDELERELERIATDESPAPSDSDLERWEAEDEPGIPHRELVFA